MRFPSIEKFTLLTVSLTLITVYMGIKAYSKLSMESMPPVVIKTYPVSGDFSVDSSITEIRVVFSKEMMTEKMYSLIRITSSTFPKISGDVYYLEDKKTCIIPVELDPGKMYAFWLNKGQWNSFRDANNRPAVPYLLVFRTIDR